MIIDEKMKDFIDNELSKIEADKEKVAEEKIRTRVEIYKLYKVDHDDRTQEHNKRLEVLQNYNDMLVNQYDLLCKRDLVLFKMVAGIGKISMEGEGRMSQEIDDNEEILS